MRIGTLTLHLPFNYGNALQMIDAVDCGIIVSGIDAQRSMA